jgi:hypothetical protein
VVFDWAGMRENKKGPSNAYIGISSTRSYQKEERTMKYILAWALGVPGVLVFGWFLINHH